MTSILIDRVDGLSSAAAIKGPCRVATTANITLYGEQTIDGVAVVTDDRVLVKDQDAGYESGIYVVDTGQWRRSKDFNRTKDVVKGTAVFVTDGTANAETLWVLTTSNPVVIGTSTITFSNDAPVPGDDTVTNTKLADMPTATIKGRATAGTGNPEDLTGSQAREVLDPDEEVLTGEGLKLTYHKARGSWHVKAFGSSLTDVGAGNAAVDTAALQSAMSSGEIIDITGAILEVNDEISVINESAKIGAAQESHRPAGSSSGILIDDNDLEVVFRVGHDNFEASGFFVRGQNDNELTTMFWFERTVDTYRDIDARLINMALNIGGRAAFHKGRGLEVSGCTVSDLHIASFELDQPASWTPRGSASIDGIDTGTRGYRFNNNRAHAIQSPFVKNTGTYAVNIGGIEVNGLIADVGADGGLFQGVFIDLQANDIQCRYSAQAGSRMVEFQPGSRNSTFTNFNAVGYIGASGNRLSNHAIRMTSSAALPIQDIFFIGGSIGPTLQAGVNLLGDGDYKNIVFNTVTWKGIGQDGGTRSPIQINVDIPSSVIKLIGTHGRDNFASHPFLTALNTPADNELIRDITSTVDGSFSAWATAGVVQTT